MMRGVGEVCRLAGGGARVCAIANARVIVNSIRSFEAGISPVCAVAAAVAAAAAAAAAAVRMQQHLGANPKFKPTP